jgi:hypothetical protein
MVSARPRSRAGWRTSYSCSPAPTPYTAEEACAGRSDTHPIWPKNGTSTASFMYQIGLSDDPHERRVAEDERRWSELEWGNTWLQQKIRHPEIRRAAARTDWTKGRPGFCSARARHGPSPTRVRLWVPGGLDPNNPSGGSCSSVISPRSRWRGGLGCFSRVGCVQTSR